MPSPHRSHASHGIRKMQLSVSFCLSQLLLTLSTQTSGMNEQMTKLVLRDNHAAAWPLMCIATHKVAHQCRLSEGGNRVEREVEHVQACILLLGL